MSEANGAPPYQVSYLPAVREQLRVWGRWAKAAGRWAWYADLVREVDRRLHTDPRTWGDPQYNYYKAAFLQYRGLGPAFIVYYAVHDTRSVVLVEKVVPTPSGPLADIDDEP